MPNIKKESHTARDLREVSDNPELTKKDLAKAKPFAEVYKAKGTRLAIADR